MSSKNLVSTPITDKNGKSTTVYRRSEQAETLQDRGVPNPVTTAHTAPKGKKKVSSSYEDRCKSIQACCSKIRV